MRLIGLIGAIILSQAAVAGFTQIQGSARGILESGDSLPLLIVRLQVQANSYARNLCPSWQPIQQTSPYEVHRSPVSSAGEYIYVSAKYACGESDY